MMDEKLLTVLEAAHRERCGTERRFCYVETLWIDQLYKLSIVEEDEPGHFPVSEDVAFGTQREMRLLATQLNKQRLDLGPRQTAVIVASSMTGAVERARRH